MDTVIILADVHHELPIEYTVTKASKGEREQFKKHIEMLPREKVEQIETACADKGYDSEDMIEFLKGKGIKPIIDIKNQWRGEKTKQYKDTLRYQYQNKVYSIELNYDRRVFTPIARDSKKWQRKYNRRTALERINGRMDRDFNLENHKVRGLKKATVLIDIMMIAMMGMAKGHIINKQPEKIRKLKAT